MFNQDEVVDIVDEHDQKDGGSTSIFQSIENDDGITQKNLLLEVVTRELTNQGNFLNVDGNSLSVKNFLRDWDTDYLYNMLHGDYKNNHIYLRQN